MSPFSPEGLDRSEYARRWIVASSYLFGFALRLAAGVWLSLGGLIFVAPAGRFGAVAWFVWLSSVAAVASIAGAAAHARYKATQALRLPTIWRDYYAEPWFFGADEVKS